MVVEEAVEIVWRQEGWAEQLGGVILGQREGPLRLPDAFRVVHEEGSTGPLQASYGQFWAS